VFCKKAKGTLELYVGECEKIRTWFRGLGDKNEEILERLWGEDLDRGKEKILKRLCREKEKVIRTKDRRQRAR